MLFDDDVVRTYELRVEPADLATMAEDPSAEVYVPGTFVFEDEQLPVGVRYKGNGGAFRPPCSTNLGGPRTGKCSIKVSFNWADPQGRFKGVKKLNFHAMNRDPSMLRDRLGYGIYREMGLPAPRAMHARLLINGELEGLFVVVEQIDGRFTRSRFTEGGKGNLYKEIWPIHDDPQAYLNALTTNEDENPSVERFVKFKQAVDSGMAEMERWVDRQAMIDYIAVDRTIINDDGIFHFWCATLGQGNNPGGIGNHNYYWYEPVAEDRFWLIPWDLDNAFNVNPTVHIATEWTESGSCTCGFNSQRAPSCDPLIRLFAQWKPEVDEAIDRVLAGPLSQKRVEDKLAGWSDQITPFVQESEGLLEAHTLEEFEEGLAELRTTIETAREHRGYPYGDSEAPGWIPNADGFPGF